MQNTRVSRAAHALRKQNNLQKEFAKFKDGMGWARAEQSRLDAMARKGLI
jgi:hypothetical protein